jgi:hypothetical protein
MMSLAHAAVPRIARPFAWGFFVLALCLSSKAHGAQSPALLAPDDVIAHMETRNAERQQALQSWVSRRRYEAGNQRLNRAAFMLVEMHFAAPDKKSFEVKERSGSGSVHKRVFTPLLETEVSNAGKHTREAAEVSRRNYTFKFVEYDPAAGAYVFAAEPLTQNKLLFRGKVWIDAKDFAVQRIEGEPAQRPSFWTRRTRFVHEYGKFGNFWFPVSNRTEVDLLFFGKSRMAIDYFEYSWVSVPNMANQLQRAPIALPAGSIAPQTARTEPD